MPRKYRSAAVILLLAICFGLCGSSMFKPYGLMIDTESNPLYKYVTAEDVKNSPASYNGAYILMKGRFDGIDTAANTLTAGGLKCNYTNSFRDNFTSLNVNIGDEAAVYCKCTVNIFGTMYLVDARNIIPAPAVKSSDEMFSLDEKSFDKDLLESRTLGGGKVKYYIPSSWTAVERNITESGIGISEGYQYVLNNIDGSSDPESLFVCYINKSDFDPDDISDLYSTGLAVVNNIQGKDQADNIISAFNTYNSSYNTQVYYGPRYQYFQGKYSISGKKYHTEYVFQADGDRGIILYLYFYTNSIKNKNSHLSEIMAVARFLEKS